MKPSRTCAAATPRMSGAVALNCALMTGGLIFGTVLTSSPAIAQLRSDVLEKFSADHWDRIPLSSEDPTIALRLCEQPHTDPCAVVAELWLTLPQDDRAPKSLDAELAKWSESSAQKVIEPARRTTLGGREAIETATEGEHSIHIHKQVVHDVIVFRYEDRYAKCFGWSEPADHATFSRALHDFCGSYDLSTLKAE